MDRPGIAALVAEVAGSFLYVFVGAASVVVQAYPGASGGSGLVGIALAHGLALTVLVAALGPVSGGQFNPAVTLAVWLNGRMGLVRAGAYVVAQGFGSLLAGLALRLVFDVGQDTTHLGTPVLGGVTASGGIAVEAILTIVLVGAVFASAVADRPGPWAGLMVGLAVAADILGGGPLTGAAMNPARWLGPAVASSTFDSWYVWWIGPAIGATIAAVAYRFLFVGSADGRRTPANPA